MARTGINWRRLLVGFILTTVATAISLMIVTRLLQTHTRRLVEQLLSDASQLAVSHSTAAEVQTMLQRWAKYRDPTEDSCSKDRCEYLITVSDPLADFASRGGEVRYRITSLVARGLHAHMAVARVDLAVAHGVLDKSSRSLSTDVPEGLGPPCTFSKESCSNYLAYSSGEYSLVAYVDEVEQLPTWIAGSKPAHLSYVVLKPDGCEGCLGIDAFFTPEISREDKRRLLNFNLACITTWSTCTVEEDIAPELARQYLADGNTLQH
jgi:hypothetical protein